MQKSANKVQVSYVLWCSEHVLSRSIKNQLLWLYVYDYDINVFISLLIRCHNQISLTTQISRLFPDLCRIPWYFQVSRNSRKVVTLTKVAPMQHTSTKIFTGLRWRLRVVYMWDFHHRWFSTTQPTCQCGSRSSLFFVQFPPNLVATWCNNQSSTFLFFNSPHPFPLQNG